MSQGNRGLVVVSVMLNTDTGAKGIFTVGVNGAFEVGNDIVLEVKTDFSQSRFDHLQGEFLNAVADLQVVLIFYLDMMYTRYVAQQLTGFTGLFRR